MNKALRSNPGAPVGSLVFIALMYIPWLRYLIRTRPVPGNDTDMEFAGGIILIIFGFGYLIATIALPIRLYRHRETSRSHAIAYYASLGILALFSMLIWRAT